LLDMADEQDRDGDGISGRVNRVWSAATNSLQIRRFGWKAEQPSLRQQHAAAFAGDTGITSCLFHRDGCTPDRPASREAPDGGAPEVSGRILDLVTFYSRNLAVPVRRNLDDPRVKRGEQLFAQAGCESCHRTAIRTAVLDQQPEQSGQLIH